MATNLILEGKGAACALLTTAGFRHGCADTRFGGPAIVTQLDATTLVGPGESVQIDAVGSMLIEIGA